jgi:predicted CXXCH cytochrome family protein
MSMKKAGRATLVVAVLLGALMPPGAPGQTSVITSKHNLSATGTGTIKATSETKVCVFCHTPHARVNQTPLWNHQLSTAEYTPYSSDYLTSRSYTSPNQPNQRSKLCLSCHDGTVALGAVYNNNNGPATIEMANNVTTMPAGAAGNLGTSLTNDHPVGYIYDNTKDPELVARAWPWGPPVRLDPDAGSGTLECHTCHDPHNNEHTKFLRMDNTGAALCTYCHNKTGWADAIHKTSTQSVTPPSAAATTIGEWACRNCHTSHGGGGTPYLQTRSEENTCYESACHGSTATGSSTKNIEREASKLYAHPVNTVTGKHRNPDTPASLSVPNRHAECQDCHNAHRAKKGLHTPLSNTLSDVLAGATGVEPGPAALWTQPTTFTAMAPALKEGQICFKCHSYAGLGTAPGGVSQIVGPSGQPITDQAMEFNPANRSAHPVQVPTSQQSGAAAPRSLTADQMKAPWTATGTQTMYCSDCHGNDQPTSATVAQGPHGADSRFMLTGRGTFWPANRSGVLWSLNDIRANLNSWQTDLFCANCHTLYSGGRFSNNAHDASEHQDASVRCITCHVAVPHGAERSRLIGYASDPAPYNYSGTGTYDRLVITGFMKASGPDRYERESCSMTGVCHGTEQGRYEP